MLNGIDTSYMQNNVEINISIIKTVFIILCTYYTNFRITNTKLELSFKLLYKYIYIVVIAIICGLIKYGLNYFISLICSILIVSIIFSENNNMLNALWTTIISLAINYVISFCTIIISFIVNVIIQINDNYVNLGIIIVSHIALLYNVLKMKRLKYGLSFLKGSKENDYIDILVLNVSVTILVSTIIIVNSSIILARDLAPGLIISVIIMIITIQKTLQLYYKQKLLVQELNETKQELIETKKELKQLEEENLNFSKKSHTLAHRQKSLEHKILELTTKSEISTEEVGEVENKLEEIKKDLYKETEVVELTKTEIVEIDDMLKYMQAECIKNKIGFELQIAGNIHYMTNNFISKEDLEILLADHIKDAIIAINHTDNINRSILVRLGEIDGIYSLYIYDSGVEFEIETLKNLGKEPSTTHADEGGTGMGFMNTFDTLRKYQASLTIKEINNPTKDNYTKVLIFKFDKKGEFQITSYRQKKLLERDIQNKIYIK